jgi:(3S)-malyl-CoA thioesterase
MMLMDYPPRSLLYVPGSNIRALEKARGLAADMLIIDLEDAVPFEQKSEARDAMRTAVQGGYPGKRIAVRINGSTSEQQEADLAALDGLALDAIVLPKVENISDLDPIRPFKLAIFAMIETPAAIYIAREIAADPAVYALIAGLNDLAHELKLPGGIDRAAMGYAIQAILLAARAGGAACYDGVYNAIDDAAGFAAEAAEGRRLGFDGKSLIHPSQVNPCNCAFAPSEGEIAAAAALVAASTGGAQRHAGQMIEDMHVAAARALLERAGRPS